MDGPDKQTLDQDSVINEPTDSGNGGIEILQHGDVKWLDVSDPSAATFKQLAADYHLDPLHLEECTQKVQHTEVDRNSDYIFLVLRPPVFDSRSGRVLAEQVGIFLGHNYLITVHEGESAGIENLIRNCIHPNKVTENFAKGSAFLLYIFIGYMLAGISNMVEQIQADLDDIEDQVFDDVSSDAENISRIRQKIVKMRRIIGPKRLVLHDLADQIGLFAGQDMPKYYVNNTKSVNRLWEMVDEAKETVEIYKDADFTTSTEQTNKTLAVLTLVFTFTIPVTVLGTLYGMNILLPGSINGRPWTFWGQYTTLGLAIGLSVIAAVVMYLYLRKKKWL
ncbi:MAG: magnesium transporter CorA family protein [Candidatus Saccharimonadales bacterium]